MQSGSKTRFCSKHFSVSGAIGESYKIVHDDRKIPEKRGCAKKYDTPSLKMKQVWWLVAETRALFLTCAGSLVFALRGIELVAHGDFELPRVGFCNASH